MLKMPWRKQITQAIRWQGDHLSLVQARGFQIQKSMDLMIRETPRDILRSKVIDFFRESSGEVTAVISRSEIFQKEVTLSGVGKEFVRQAIDSQLQTILPFSVKDMAWGISLEAAEDKTRGVLMAVSEKRIREVLSFFEEVGISAERLEIVTEDQALLWTCLERGEKGPALVLERNDSRILALFFERSCLMFSRVFELSPESDFDVAEILPELSLNLLEGNYRPGKILLTGDWAQDHQAMLSGRFSVPVETLKTAEAAALCGAIFSQKYSRISLLPKDAKIHKRQRERREILRELSLVSAVLFLIFSAGFTARLYRLDQTASQLAAQSSGLEASAREAQKNLMVMKKAKESRATKNRVLMLLRNLALNSPSAVFLKELRVEGDQIMLGGESPTYGGVSAMAEMLERETLLKEVRLRGSRLRKNGDAGLLEFEVTGKWNI